MFLWTIISSYTEVPFYFVGTFRKIWNRSQVQFTLPRPFHRNLFFKYCLKECNSLSFTGYYLRHIRWYQRENCGSVSRGKYLIKRSHSAQPQFKPSFSTLALPKTCTSESVLINFKPAPALNDFLGYDYYFCLLYFTAILFLNPLVAGCFQFNV